MAQQTINNTDINPDSLYSAATKINSNFTETYSGLASLETTKVPLTTTVNGHALSANITLSAADVGLTNVNNTSDLNKPVSTATQTALNSKVQLLVHNAVTQIYSTGTTYHVPFTPVTGSTGLYRYYFRVAGTLKNLYCWGIGHVGTTDTTWTVMRGSGTGSSSATSLTVTHPSTGGWQTVADTTHSISIAANDWIEVRMVNSDSFAMSTPGYSIEFLPS